MTDEKFIINLPIDSPDKVSLIYQIIDLQPLFPLKPDDFWDFVNDFIYDMTGGKAKTLKDLTIEELKKVYEYLTKEMKDRREYEKKYGDKIEDPRD